MNKINAVQFYVNEILESISNIQNYRVALIHTYGVAECCCLIAIKRGKNPEISYISGLLHDIYSYKTGVCCLHSINGAEMIRVAFKNELKDTFMDDEQIIIRSAIFHHSDKEHVHDEYDEILKDADVFQHWLYNLTRDNFLSRRLINLLKELGLPFSEEVPIDTTKKQKESGFKRDLLGDVAEKLAKKKICGEQFDNDFMKIIKYYPEITAFDELIYAWCAAFVYHCAILAGLDIPIRYKPMANTRFACVEAWLEWGKKNGFCLYEKDGFTPSRGDIIIYNNIVPPENKPENTPWYDHIGILLSVDGENIIVAEGNIDNKNISGIICRNRNEIIGCYVRIPDNYEYDGWKYDYKTKKVRIQKL